MQVRLFNHARGCGAYRRTRARWAKFAPFMAVCFVWSGVVAPAAQAWANQPAPAPGHTRRLSAKEMRGIVGAQQIAHSTPIELDSGTTYPWEGSYGDANTGNGNKLTSVPLVGWTARGGLPVAFALYHNSEGNHNSELGHKWTFSYDIYLVATSNDSGDLMTVHWGNDLAYGFSQNIDGSFSAPTGIHDTLVANGSPVTSYDLTTPGQVKYHFTNPNGTGWYVASISDPNGNTVGVYHNTGNYVTSIVDPTSRTISLSYDGSNRISTVTDPLSRVWTMHYNASNELTQVDWPALGGTTYNEQFAYDAGGHHDITNWTDKRGHSSTFTYNSDDSLATETDACGNTTSFSYTSTATTITDANSHSTVHTYSSGRLTSITDALNHSESYGYDSANNRTSVTDRRGHQTTFTFDGNGNMLTRTDPLTHEWTWTYNSRNEALTATDPLSHTVTNVYDTAGNLTSTTDALSHATTFTYDGNGLRQTAADALSHETDFGYDTDGNLTSVTDPNGNETTFAVNGLGARTSVTDALLHTTSYTLDNWLRPTTITFPGSSTVVKAYDANSNVTSVTDQNSHTTTMTYDACDRVTSVVNGRGDEVDSAYDALGKKGLLSSKTDGNLHTTTFSYNTLNLPSSTAYPDSTSESWTYDNNENVASHTDQKSQTVAYTYDNADRLTLIDYPTGTDTSFSYDAANRRTGMTDSTGTTTWNYDAANRLASLVQPNGTVAYTFDDANRRTGVTLNTTSTWTYAFDAGGRVSSVTNPYSEQASYTYDAANRVTQLTAGNGAVTTFGYDNLNHTTDVWHKTSGTPATTLGRYQYSYDAAGNVTERDDNDGSATTFGYDGADQLTSETRTGTGAYGISYTYDHNGNRTSKTVGGVTDTYSYDNHDHLTSTSSKSYHYDLNGNCDQVTSGGQTTYLSYDYENRLTGITYPSSATNSFRYNGLGLRVQKVDSGGTVNYATDGSDVASPVLADTNATYTPGLSERRGTTSKFYHSDALGSTRGITDASQSATDGILYDAFGMTVSRTGTTPTPFGFVGAGQYQTDPDSGLMLLGHRYYDPSTGRFISSDPAQAGENWYAYCGNNPLTRTDPQGLVSPIDVVSAVGQFFGGNPNDLIGVIGSIGGSDTYDPVHDVHDVNGGLISGIIDRFDTPAITIGHYIMHPHPIDQATYGHELVHVGQGNLLGGYYLPVITIGYVRGAILEESDPAIWEDPIGAIHDGNPWEIGADLGSGNIGSNKSWPARMISSLLSK